ncbi:hypothetical protein ADK55_23645 [Streptomyces sp. WM4235]|uniref:hypothetical protein n=1 Tax=Streptomyces sp. WM4235 TaxID=1415551 RepID=UPI0006B029AA|nr:hypothetical protein [Streptomyces sp. WM4235]KOU43502.1 hypothetical protein ADK55_23645 [Streptomyces sp. WM4235]
MSCQTKLADAYDAVYSAASRMMWVQQNRLWRLDSLGGGWPEERRQAWRELEAALSVSEHGLEPREGEPSDPARHLISRRAAGPIDRPVTFPEAVGEWKARMAGDPGPYEPRMEPYPDDYLVPGRAVVVPENHMLTLTAPLWDLAYRLAPGRPPVTIAGDTAELSRMVHEAADGLREALGTSVPTPHPADAVSVARVSHRPSDVDDLQVRYEALARAAWHASENMPTLKDIRESGDYSVEPAASKAAQVLQDLLAGRSGVFWRESHELIDPRVHTVSGVDWPEGRPVPTLIAAEANSFELSVAAGLKPSAPRAGQRRFYREKGELEKVAISAVRAEILAEILDEYAARIHPGAESGIMHLSAYDLTEFITSGIGRELGETVGF